MDWKFGGMQGFFLAIFCQICQNLSQILNNLALSLQKLATAVKPAGGTRPKKKSRGEMGWGVRWKFQTAEADALKEPISNLYNQMREWEPVKALLADSSVILSIEVSKAEVLDRACFGKLISAATSPPCSARSSSTRSPWIPKVNAEPDIARLFQLGLEEAFFLASHVGCIYICKQTVEGLEAMSTEEAWRCMQTSRPEFGYLYIAYAHFRAKNWVVRSGIQYGADFMAYRHHPCRVHSDYAVVVMVEGQEERLKTWTELQAMNRLCGSVAKTLLLLHVIPKREGPDMSSPLCQGDFTVEAVEVRRWLPEKKSREENVDQTLQPVRNEPDT